MLKGNKSEKIRKLLAKGIDRQQIVEDLKVSPQLVYAVAVKGGYLKKKAKKAKKQSKIIKAVKQMDRELNKLSEPTLINWALGDNGEILDLNQGGKVIDLVNSPPHYTEGGFETIDFIEAKDLNYRLGNVIKYVSRAGRKVDTNPVEDLEKALWYLNREIEARRNA